MKLTASMVLYKSDPEQIRKSTASLFRSPFSIHLIIIDNSPDDGLRQVFEELPYHDMDYYFNNGRNCGFGSAHNLAISRTKDSTYHLILNSDVYFDPSVLVELIDYLEINSDVGLITPSAYLPNGENTFTARKYPNLTVMLVRRFLPKRLHSVFNRKLADQEMRNIAPGVVANAQVICGCFMLVRRNAFEKLGGFDEQFFLYFEDYDLTVRMSKIWRTVLYSPLTIYHEWGRAPYKDWKMAFKFVRSSIRFFRKNGWRLW